MFRSVEKSFFDVISVCFLMELRIQVREKSDRIILCLNYIRLFVKSGDSGR